MRIFGIVSYKGSGYLGWQKQEHKNTIQDEIEKVLSKILNADIHIYGSGRTDAGVHALGQTFHFDIDKINLDLSRLRYSLNCLLPPDIHVILLKYVDESFHSRFSAKSKSYRYQIHIGEDDPFLVDTFWIVHNSFDLNLFKVALSKFVGKHNFCNFTSKENDEFNFIRNIYDIEINCDNNNIFITLNGDGFMRYMVRYIIGTSLEIATLKEDISFIDNLLDCDTNRHIVSYKAPANGLFLVKVDY